jgi:hypothetical protein
MTQGSTRWLPKDWTGNHTDIWQESIGEAMHSTLLEKGLKLGLQRHGSASM